MNDEAIIKELESKEHLYRSMQIVHTDHALERIKERFNLSKTSVPRLAEEALRDGSFFISKRSKFNSLSFLLKDKIFIFAETNGPGNSKKLALLTAYPITTQPPVKDSKQIYKAGKKRTLTKDDRAHAKHKKAANHRKLNKYKPSHHEEPQG